jgi:hypothetical protein
LQVPLCQVSKKCFGFSKVNDSAEGKHQTGGGACDYNGQITAFIQGHPKQLNGGIHRVEAKQARSPLVFDFTNGIHHLRGKKQELQ